MAGVTDTYSKKIAVYARPGATPTNWKVPFSHMMMISSRDFDISQPPTGDEEGIDVEERQVLALGLLESSRIQG